MKIQKLLGSKQGLSKGCIGAQRQKQTNLGDDELSSLCQKNVLALCHTTVRRTDNYCSALEP